MGTSVYFNNQGATREQLLVEDLIIESIKNHGIDLYYIPRNSRSEIDELFGDDPVGSFTEAIKIEMYLETAQDFEGNQEVFSKFGLEIQKTGRVCIARRTFERYVANELRNVPKEGDLIYLPVQAKLMEVKFVEEEKNFFQLGKKAPYMYVLSLEAFKYNGELINTGYTEIDAVADARAIGVEYTLTSGNGTYFIHEVVYQGTDLANANAKGYVSDWDKPTLKIKIRNTKGEFQSNIALIGYESGANFIMATGNTMSDTTTTFEDNFRLETEATEYLDFTEENPFGEV